VTLLPPIATFTATISATPRQTNCSKFWQGLIYLNVLVKHRRQSGILFAALPVAAYRKYLFHALTETIFSVAFGLS